MADQVVGLEFVVTGERQATDAIKRVAQNQDKLRNDILRGADALQRIQSDWAKTNRLVDQGTINSKAAARSQVILAREYALLNGYVKANGALNTQKALAEMRAAQAAKAAADAAKAQAAADAAAASEKKRLTQSYEQLRASIDPAVAAQQRMRQTQQMLREAVNSGAISARQAADALRQYRAAAQAAGAAGQQVGRRTNQLGVLFQQTGYQVGDFAVQVQSGTNIMVALGQQATQLVGTFGMLAQSTRMIAVFAGLGIAIPIITGIAAAMLRMRKEVDDSADSVDDLNEAMKSLDSTLKDWINTKRAAEAGITVEELLGVQSIESAEDALVAAREELEKFTRAREALANAPTAEGAFVNLVTGLITDPEGRELAALQEVMKAENRLADLRRMQSEERLANFQDEYQSQSDNLDLQRTIAQFGEDSRQVREMQLQQDIESYNRQIDLQVRQNELTVAHGVALKRTYEEAVRLEASIEDGKIMSEKLADGFDTAKEKLSDLADEALTLRDRLFSAAGAAYAIAQETMEDVQYARSVGRGRGTSQGATAEGINRYNFEAQLASLRIPETSTTSTSTGGGASGNAVESQLEQLEKSLATEREVLDLEYESKQQTLESALQKGFITRQRFSEMEVQLERKKQSELAAIERQVQETKVSTIAGGIQQVLSAAANGNEKMLKMARVVGAAEALINSYRAAAQTLADPTLPFYVKFGAAAATLAAGLNMVNAIKSGGGGSASSATATSSAPASPEFVAAPAPTPQRVIIDGIDRDSLITGEQLANIFEALYKENEDRGFVFEVAR